MFGQDYDHELLRKYAVVFGTLFNDLTVTNRDTAGNRVGVKKVPLTYAPRDKLIARVNQDPSLDKPSSLQLPRMSYEIRGFQYDGSRKLKTRGYTSYGSDPDLRSYVYNPVPYNIAFDLHIAVKSVKDGNQLLEQILPYFTPDWISTVEILPEIPPIDVPIVLSGVNLKDDYEGAFTDRRVIIWTLSFEMRAYFYGYVRESKIIKFVTVGLHASQTETIETGGTANEAYTVYPGLTVDGEPTSDANTAIDYHLVNIDDDYGYVEAVTEPLKDEA